MKRIQQRLRGETTGVSSPAIRLAVPVDPGPVPRCNSWAGSPGRGPARVAASSSSMPSSHNAASAYEACMETSVSTSPRPNRRQRANSILHDDASQHDLLRLVTQAKAPPLQRHTRNEPRDLLEQSETAPLFEYMCVCGLVRATLPVEVEVLASVPATAEIPKDMCWFVFPDRTPGCKPATEDTVEFKRGYEEMQTGTNTYMICWNADSDRPIYVFVVRIWELFEEPSAWVGVDRIQTGSLIAAGRHVTERAYCIASRNPYARLFWQMLWELGRLEYRRLMANDTADRVRQSKRIQCFISMMTTLSTKHYAPGKELVLENAACFSTGRIQYQVPGEWQSLRVSVAAICLPVLLRAMSAQHIVMLVAALLTETRIVVMGRDPGRVSACVMALASIVAPFAWQGSLWPLLPPSLTELFQSPVSFLAGVATHSRAQPEGVDEALITAMVDRNELIVTGTVPALPCPEVLRSALDIIHGRMIRGLPAMNDVCDDRRPFDALERDKALCTTSALEALSSYTVWVIASIRRRLPDAAEFEYTQGLEDKVCAATRAPNQPFVRALLNTQHWALLATSFSELSLDETGAGGEAYEAQEL
jgi:hypothetical protein